ncbi:polysaccharide deacetylase family protein [Evansella sp. LMS18]|uniref:polysaccharide deacetylase family protein n=1 Tax=Evansella sp. LMS18 TaxID=2924033 RepID=UPI0020D00044|nr:polysaccharide deacetylase family protein [Evansella sp. LMS18]UTR10515.1 polysaccharide deacetylase family protein [Evansella sp. LMS18]
MYDTADDNVITELKRDEVSTGKKVMLTFDDGPGKVLPDILDILKKEDAKAMFFWQSRLLHQKRPWKRVLEEGHVIGSHTRGHPNLAALNEEEQFRELLYSKMKIEKVTGESVKYFRPPFGQYNEHTVTAAKRLGMEIVMWKIASLDWELKEEPGKIIGYVQDNLQDRAIILLHELEQTVKILPDLIRTIKEEGYEISLL